MGTLEIIEKQLSAVPLDTPVKEVSQKIDDWFDHIYKMENGRTSHVIRHAYHRRNA